MSMHEPHRQGEQVARCAREAKDWLFTKAIPLWIDKGIDRDQGGFFDALDPITLSNCAEFKRLRVITRQLYVLSEGIRWGVPGAQDTIQPALDYLFTRFAHPDGGFASCCDLAGAIQDPTRDLYDLAFVLFALANAYGVTKEPILRDRALHLLAFIRSDLSHPAGGFHEATPSRMPRRQNPHMHLLEAALACAEQFSEPCFLVLADEIVQLFTSCLCDRSRGLVFEYFSDDWCAPIRSDGMAVVEPGHHFEWAWLLKQYRRLGGTREASDHGIAPFALARGVDATTGFLVGELFEDGSVAMSDVRLWPHAEWLRAATTIGEAAGSVTAAWSALRRFLDTPIQGIWNERWNARDRAFEAGPVPATSLYHLTSAIVALASHSRAVAGRHGA